MLFSAWQFTRREENENRLALVASAVALRDVEVSCPGFCRAARGDHAERRLGRLRPARQAGRQDEPLRLDLSRSGAGLARRPEVVRVSDRRQLRPGHAARGVGHRHAGARVVAPARCHRRGGDAVLRDPDGRAGRAPAGRRRRQNAHVIAVWVALDDAATPVGEYHSPECRPGGRYDRHPETPDWPSAR